MGMFSERLATTITAELVSWRLRENGAIQGIIANSNDRQYIDGQSMIFMKTELIHYRRTSEWPDHFIMKTQVGLYFLLRDSARYQG